MFSCQLSPEYQQTQYFTMVSKTVKLSLLIFSVIVVLILGFAICISVFGSGKNHKTAKNPELRTWKEDEDVLANFSWAGPRSRWLHPTVGVISTQRTARTATVQRYFINFGSAFVTSNSVWILQHCYSVVTYFQCISIISPKSYKKSNNLGW